MDDIDFQDFFGDDGGGLSVVDIGEDGTIIEAYNDTTYNAADGSVTVSEIEVTAASSNSCPNSDMTVALGVTGTIAEGLGLTGGAGAYVSVGSNGVSVGVYTQGGVAVGSGASAGVEFTAGPASAVDGNSVSVNGGAGGDLSVGVGGNQCGPVVSVSGGVGAGATVNSTTTNMIPLN